MSDESKYCARCESYHAAETPCLMPRQQSELAQASGSPARECSECCTVHHNLTGITERDGEDWYTFAYCPTCKQKRWTKAYRWENDQTQQPPGTGTKDDE